MPERKFIQKAVMYLDGAKGSAKQVHDILEGDFDAGDAGEKTGIQKVWERESRNDPGKRWFVFGGKIFDSFADALDAYDRERAR